MIYLLLIPILFILAVFGVGAFLSESGYEGPKSDHFSGRKFYLPLGHKINGFKDVFKLMISHRPPKWPKNYEIFACENQIHNARFDHSMIYHVNHSSFLIQLNGYNILIDPIWSEFASPFSFAGPQRQRPPGIPLDFLPKIDLVVISHNHYDHLDIATLNKLKEKFDPEFIVPLGVSQMKALKAYDKIKEIDWRQTISFNELKITGTPAIHFGARGLFDRGKTLWCGFLIEGNKTIYYTGDTAYDSNIFKTIGAQNDIDLCIIPIGAYLPRWFMKHVHTNPEEAVQIHLDLKSTQSMACHFGCFPLAGDGQGEAERDLLIALKTKQIDPSDFTIPEEGKVYSI